MSWAIPIKRLHESDNLVAFHHPSPSYPVHILIVPKVTRHSMTAISVADSDLLLDVFMTVQRLASELQLSGYRLICNGGGYQDVHNCISISLVKMKNLVSTM